MHRLLLLAALIAGDATQPVQYQGVVQIGVESMFTPQSNLDEARSSAAHSGKPALLTGWLFETTKASNPALQAEIERAKGDGVPPYGMSLHVRFLGVARSLKEPISGFDTEVTAISFTQVQVCPPRPAELHGCSN
ncbi:MAG: hypothetical protein KAX56_03015 [Phenylobacterium sp.]|nr:hypothetical protein [Phenylobacterium sp.]